MDRTSGKDHVQISTADLPIISRQIAHLPVHPRVNPLQIGIELGRGRGGGQADECEAEFTGAVFEAVF